MTQPTPPNTPLQLLQSLFGRENVCPTLRLYERKVGQAKYDAPCVELEWPATMSSNLEAQLLRGALAAMRDLPMFSGVDVAKIELAVSLRAEGFFVPALDTVIHPSDETSARFAAATMQGTLGRIIGSRPPDPSIFSSGNGCHLYVPMLVSGTYWHDWITSMRLVPGVDLNWLSVAAARDNQFLRVSPGLGRPSPSLVLP